MLRIRFSFVRERVQEGVIDVVYCPTEDMVADALTKGSSSPSTHQDAGHHLWDHGVIDAGECQPASCRASSHSLLCGRVCPFVVSLFKVIL